MCAVTGSSAAAISLTSMRVSALFCLMLYTVLPVLRTGESNRVKACTLLFNSEVAEGCCSHFMISRFFTLLRLFVCPAASLVVSQARLNAGTDSTARTMFPVPAALPLPAPQPHDHLGGPTVAPPLHLLHWGTELDAVLQVQPHQHQVQGKDHLP